MQVGAGRGDAIMEGSFSYWKEFSADHSEVVKVDLCCRARQDAWLLAQEQTVFVGWQRPGRGLQPRSTPLTVTSKRSLGR